MYTNFPELAFSWFSLLQDNSRADGFHPSSGPVLEHRDIIPAQGSPRAKGFDPSSGFLLEHMDIILAPGPARAHGYNPISGSC